MGPPSTNAIPPKDSSESSGNISSESPIGATGESSGKSEPLRVRVTLELTASQVRLLNANVHFSGRSPIENGEADVGRLCLWALLHEAKGTKREEVYASVAPTQRDMLPEPIRREVSHDGGKTWVNHDE